MTEAQQAADQRWSARFPNLFRPQPFSWGGMGDGRLQIAFSTATPPDELIGNVKIIARCGDGIVVFETDLGWRNIPGGTREDGETIGETAGRELAEEVGGRITSPLDWIGAFRVDHSAAGRYRPHLPFPISYWAYVAADVELETAPSNPVDGEQVTAVHVLPVSDAIEFLAQFDDGPGLDIVRLAEALELTPA